MGLQQRPYRAAPPSTAPESILAANWRDELARDGPTAWELRVHPEVDLRPREHHHLHGAITLAPVRTITGRRLREAPDGDLRGGALSPSAESPLRQPGERDEENDVTFLDLLVGQDVVLVFGGIEEDLLVRGPFRIRPLATNGRFIMSVRS
jgi:hypothetical protein